MPYTMRDFIRDSVKKNFSQLTREEREDVLQTIPIEQRLAGLTPEQIREYLDRLPAEPPAPEAAAKEVAGRSRLAAA